AYPWKGKNAIWQMNDFLNKLIQQYPIPKKQEWITTINLSKIETTNNSFNKIPDDCSIYLDIRYIPKDKDKILHDLKALMPKDFKLEQILFEPGLDVDENNYFLKKLMQITQKIVKRKVKLYGAQGSSDARHFTRIGCPGVEFGPYGEGIGTDNEWVSISSLEKYHKILETFLKSIN
ncbi:MAG: M20/M25/M40 family metallo-hydrolase, partial [Patescibacteria group bacterium]|nr:M20/M25/M40 family metallo-hydrolase [Patescibacteria group bacterium]